MNKVLLTIAAAAFALNVSAQVQQSTRVVAVSPVAVQQAGAKKVAKIAANQRWAGLYSSDALAQYGMGVPDYPGDNKAAIFLTPDMMKGYVGKKIVGMRVGLCSAVGSSRFFIMGATGSVSQPSLGDEITSQDVASTSTGWNEITLSTPVEITSGQGYFVGYDYTQKNTKSGQYYSDDCYPFSCVEEGNSDNALWIYTNIPASSGGSGEGWYGFTTNGNNLSVQLLVEGSFAQYDVTPSDFGTITGSINKNVSIEVSFFNNSVEAVSSLDYVVTVDGVAGEEQHVAISPAVATGNNGLFKISVPCGSVDAKKNVKIEITKVNGHDNEAEDKVAEGTVGVSSTLFERNMVIEEFTTEKCPNCPRVAGYLHDYLETADLSKVYAVCHHSAYYTDWLTQQCDKDLTYLFNDAGYTYAPALMFNREPDFNSSYAEGEKDNVTIPGSANEIKQIVDYYLTQTQANAQLSMQVVPNSDNSKVTLIISGEANNAYDIDNSLLTVYMTEDNIAAKSQSGASGKFTHQHVIRYYNSSWGDPVAWANNRFSTSYDIDINKSWKKDDLRFVAFLNKHNASNVLDNRIENSIGMSLKEVTGIEGVTNNSENAVEVARYNAAGQRVDAPVKGLNIIKLSDGRTVKVIVK